MHELSSPQYVVLILAVVQKTILVIFTEPVLDHKIQHFNSMNNINIFSGPIY